MAETRQKIANDLYYAELERTSEPALAKQRAEKLADLMVAGQHYESLRRSLGRMLHKHLKQWGGFYAGLALLGLAVGLPVGLVNFTHHYAGIAKHDVLWNAEGHAKNWYKTTARPGLMVDTRTFDYNLAVEKVMRTNKGPVNFWYVRFRDTMYHRNICVLENADTWYVSICGRKK